MVILTRAKRPSSLKDWALVITQRSGFGQGACRIGPQALGHPSHGLVIRRTAPLVTISHRRMMRQNGRLAAQFSEFIRGTLRAVESEGLCLDMLGKNNLMLLTHEKPWHRDDLSDIR